MKTNLTRLFSTFLLLLSVLSGCKNQETVSQETLPRSTPEAEGVSSGAIITFLDSAEVNNHEFHSIMIIRHGKVIAEGWWHPYRNDLKHTLYSTSKSFTSTAIGFADSEKLLSVSDKVISFFPEQLPETVSPNLADMTVKDLLSMSVGHATDPTGTIRSGDDWAEAFLALPVTHDPGTKFLYNSMATYMLSAIVQKVTGETTINYLKTRLFEPLNIEGMDWEVDPKGINVGGWGLRIRTEDMARFGQLYLQKGKWNGRQVIPSGWVQEATTFTIDQAPDAPADVKEKSDWMQGYCYQFWRCRNNAFRADGAFGQYIIVMPDQDAVVAITAESPDMQDEINLIWDVLLPAMKDDALPESPSLNEKLHQRLASLSLSPVQGSKDSPIGAGVTGKKYRMDPNKGEYEAMSFHFTDGICNLIISQKGKEYRIDLGSGKWIEAETNRPGPSLTGLPGGITDFRIAGSFGWKDANTLELMLRYIESPHHERLTCKFEKDKLLVSITPSLGFGRYVTELKGSVSE